MNDGCRRKRTLHCKNGSWSSAVDFVTKEDTRNNRMMTTPIFNQSSTPDVLQVEYLSVLNQFKLSKYKRRDWETDLTLTRIKFAIWMVQPSPSPFPGRCVLRARCFKIKIIELFFYTEYERIEAKYQLVNKDSFIPHKHQFFMWYEKDKNFIWIQISFFFVFFVIWINS